MLAVKFLDLIINSAASKLAETSKQTKKIKFTLVYLYLWIDWIVHTGALHPHMHGISR